MLEITHNRYRELSKFHVAVFVPSSPGIYVLAVQLANGVLKTFHRGSADNLKKALANYADFRNSQVPEIVAEHLDRFQCYFTYLEIGEPKYREELERALAT